MVRKQDSKYEPVRDYTPQLYLSIKKDIVSHFIKNSIINTDYDWNIYRTALRRLASFVLPREKML